MPRKIVMNVPMPNDKDKSKAMKIVCQSGVLNVGVGGGNNKLEITIKEGINSVSLANSLGKKFSYVDIVSIEETKETNPRESSPSMYRICNNMDRPPCPPAY